MKKTLHICLALALGLGLGACRSPVKLDHDATAPAPVAQSQVGAVQAHTPPAGSAAPAGVASVVYFDFDRYSVRPDAQATIEAHARHLRAQSAAQVTLEGHTDAVGGREYNLALGQKRAEAVRRALVVQGVADERIEAVSYGKERLAVPDADANELNRRVELRYR